MANLARYLVRFFLAVMIVWTMVQRAGAADGALAHVGKSFLFDHGDFVVHTTWTSPERKLTGYQGKVRPLQ